MAKPITYVGLDVHKDTIAVALAASGLRGEVREYGKIPNTPAALKALAVKLAPAGRDLRFCYESGPCGYGIQRQLSGAGHECAVVAPSLIPRKPGERIKTDRRDAINLAKLHRAGELTPVWVPDQAHEAIRDVVRARQAAVRSLRQARQQLSGFPCGATHADRSRLELSISCTDRPRAAATARATGQADPRHRMARQRDSQVAQGLGIPLAVNTRG